MAAADPLDRPCTGPSTLYPTGKGPPPFPQGARTAKSTNPAAAETCCSQSQPSDFSQPRTVHASKKRSTGFGSRSDVLRAANRTRVNSKAASRSINVHEDNRSAHAATRKVASVGGLSAASCTSTTDPAVSSIPSSNIFSPRGAHRCTSDSMQSTHLGMKGPTSRSGRGVYEVTTPSKKLTPGANGLCLNTVGATSRIGPKETRCLKKIECVASPVKGSAAGLRGLCKNCKGGNCDSVCYIANDGRIAAATICRFNYCDSPRCAANVNFQPLAYSPHRKISDGDGDKINMQLSSVRNPIPRDVQRCEENGKMDASSAERVAGREGNMSDVTKEDCAVENGSGPTSTKGTQLEGCMGPADTCSFVEDGKKSMEQRMANSVDWSDRGNDDAHNSHLPYDIAGAGLELEPVKGAQASESSMARMRQRYLDCLKQHELETVRLRKQEIIASKDMGSWMLDSAIGEVLQKLAPQGEAGVRVLVEAFETVMHHGDVDS